jgi:hypothetical protein
MTLSPANSRLLTGVLETYRNVSAAVAFRIGHRPNVFQSSLYWAFRQKIPLLFAGISQTERRYLGDFFRRFRHSRRATERAVLRKLL